MSRTEAYRRPTKVPVAGILWVNLMVGFTAFVLLQKNITDIFPPETLALICMIVGIGPALCESLRKEFDSFEPIHLIAGYFTLTMAVRGLFLLRYGGHYWAYFSPALAGRALELAILGLVALYAGYYSGAGEAIARRLKPSIYLRNVEFFPPELIIFAAVVGAAAMGFYFLATSQQSLVEKAVLGSAGLFWVMPFVYFLPFALYAIFLNSENRPLSLPSLLGGSALLLLMVAFAVVRSGKGWMLRPLFYLALLRHYRHKRINPLWLLGLGSLAFIAAQYVVMTERVFNFDFRSSFDYMKVYIDQPEQFFGMVISRFYGLDGLMFSLRYVEALRGHLWGASLVELLYWFIPRALWPGKPYTFTYTISNTFSDFTGIGEGSFVNFSFPGEMYLNFGLLGLVAGGFLFGLVARAVYVYLIRMHTTGVSVLVYAVLLLHLLFFVEGPVAAQTGLLLSELLPLLLLIYIAGFRVTVPAYLPWRQ